MAKYSYTDFTLGLVLIYAILSFVSETLNFDFFTSIGLLALVFVAETSIYIMNYAFGHKDDEEEDDD